LALLDGVTKFASLRQKKGLLEGAPKGHFLEIFYPKKRKKKVAKIDS